MPSQSPNANKQPLQSLRVSLAGVQLKFSAVAGQHGKLTIPSKANRKVQYRYDTALYKTRNRVERFF